MQSADGLIRIKWAGPNTPYFEVERNNQRFYPTKRELLSIQEAIGLFVNAYPEDFTEDRIDLVDETGGLEYTLAPEIKQRMAEQEFNKKRWEALDKIARESGFDDDALAYTEFSLMPFFEAIVEECAKRAELQATTFDGSKNEGAGCHSAANAIRHFGKTIGVKKD